MFSLETIMQTEHISPKRMELLRNHQYNVFPPTIVVTQERMKTKKRTLDDLNTITDRPKSILGSGNSRLPLEFKIDQDEGPKKKKRRKRTMFQIEGDVKPKKNGEDDFTFTPSEKPLFLCDMLDFCSDNDKVIDLKQTDFGAAPPCWIRNLEEVEKVMREKGDRTFHVFVRLS